MIQLPIDAHLPQIVEAVRRSRALVLVAPPGAGKTTRVPPAILQARLLDGEHPNLVMLEPRRLAARAAAQRIADENNWQIGQKVGYQVRFENRIGPSTRLRVITEGILTRQLLDDPFLQGTGAVLLDEFHERSLHTDMAIALLNEVRQTVREDLILIVMSATLEAEPVARFLGNCPILRTEGRAFPVEIRHAQALASVTSRDVQHHVADVLEDVLAGEPEKDAQGLVASDYATPGGRPALVKAESRDDAIGDILVFLPGADEIRRTLDRLASLADRHDLLILPLHASLSADEQIAALAPAEKRKVILATNIAQTSLTIEGVRTVIDSGLARVAGYDPQRGLDRLELARISKASATQRAGRAGRNAPGQCVRLWTAAQERTMDDFEAPEIQRLDLCQTVLTLHAWGKTDVRKFGWYEAPPDESCAAAERLLAMLGALSAEQGGAITPLGHRLLDLPVHPRLGRLLVGAADRGLLEEGAALAALLSEKDVVRPGSADAGAMYRPATTSSSDLLIRLEILKNWDARRSDTLGFDVDPIAIRQTAKARDELLRIGRRIAGATAERRRSPHSAPEKKQPSDLAAAWSPDEHELLKLPLLAYPDRVARRRAEGAETAVMVGGGGVRLSPECSVRQAEFFLALDARQDQRRVTREALVRVASAIDPRWLAELFPPSMRTERGVRFDPVRERVVGFTTLFYRDLALREDQSAAVDPVEAATVLAEALRPRSQEIFSADPAAAQWLARLALLRRAMPEHPWPTLGAAELAELLAAAAQGRRSIEALRKSSLVQLLQDTLAYPLDRLFEQQAPHSLAVPSGSQIKLDYAGPKPVLAVRLQELFGWTDTPRIAGGRVGVVLHLLGPNYRPVQITEDLRSFWSSAYFQVRKDLRTRYPKHSWPDDPLTAAPVAKGRTHKK